MNKLPIEIQNKIWQEVFNNYQHEHKLKFQKILKEITSKSLFKHYYININRICNITDKIQQSKELSEYYQWLADCDMIFYSGNMKYHEIYLINPNTKRNIYPSVNYVTRKEFEDLGKSWYPISINDENSNVDNENSNEDIEDNKMFIDCWIEISKKNFIFVEFKISENLVD